MGNPYSRTVLRPDISQTDNAELIADYRREKAVPQMRREGKRNPFLAVSRPSRVESREKKKTETARCKDMQTVRSYIPIQSDRFRNFESENGDCDESAVCRLARSAL